MIRKSVKQTSFQELTTKSIAATNIDIVTFGDHLGFTHHQTIHLNNNFKA